MYIDRWNEEGMLTLKVWVLHINPRRHRAYYHAFLTDINMTTYSVMDCNVKKNILNVGRVVLIFLRLFFLSGHMAAALEDAAETGLQAAAAGPDMGALAGGN